MEKRSFFKTTVLMLFALTISSTAAQSSTDLYKKIWSLSVQISSGYQPEGKERVAVVDFTTLEGETCKLGELIAEKLTTYLQRSDNFILVERTHLKRVMAENQISRRKLFDRATATQLGTLVGAKAIITGSITDMGKIVDANARLINCEKATILSTASAVINKSKEVEELIGIKKAVQLPEDTLSNEYEEYKLVVEKLKILEQPIAQPESAFKIDLWTDRQRYLIGEDITFNVRANRDCYLTIIDIGASGNITLLYPNKLKQANFIRAYETYTIPSERSDRFVFKIEPPSGIERVKAIASLNPLTIENYQYEKYAYRSIKPDDKAGTRDIGMYLNKLSEVPEENRWAVDSLNILIE